VTRGRGRQVRRVRQAQTTVLIVGEGDTDVAFIRHLSRLYNVRGCGVSVTIRNAHGYGPEQVLEYAIGQARVGDYDRRAALLDTDMPWTEVVKKRARSKRIEMLPSDPCLEGLLLRILNKPVPPQSDLCKRELQGLDLKDPACYQKYFPELRARFPSNRQQTVFLSGVDEAFTAAVVLLHPPIPSWLCGFV